MIIEFSVAVTRFDVTVTAGKWSSLLPQMLTKHHLIQQRWLGQGLHWDLPSSEKSTQIFLTTIDLVMEEDYRH